MRAIVSELYEATKPVGVFEPFQSRPFLWLWVGVVFSSVGSWAQTVGAQWLFINAPNAATIVSLVQTAATLPMVLFALAAGVLSDAFDRRRLMLWVQVYIVIVSGLLAVLTAISQMPPLLLLAFTFAIGMGNAVMVSTWQPLITELVPRAHFA